MKIISIIGARPQIIKEAMISEVISNFEFIEHITVHTGQHFDFNMSEVFLRELKLPNLKYNLEINKLPNIKMISKMIDSLEQIYKLEHPDYVLVYGDTDSTLAASICAKKMGIKVVHVEAGLRQFPKTMPEEINRVLTDHSSFILAAPTSLAVENLKLENIKCNVIHSGDIMYDLFIKLKDTFNLNIIERFPINKYEYYVFTLHRDFNVDSLSKLKSILDGIPKLFPKHKIVFIIHPRTKKRIKEYRLETLLKAYVVSEPLGYLDMMGLINNSIGVITDSGGLQKEAYFHKRNSFTIMEDSSWRELHENAYSKFILIGEDNSLHYDNSIFNDSFKEQFYGNGEAAKKLIDYIVKKHESENYE